MMFQTSLTKNKSQTYTFQYYRRTSKMRAQNQSSNHKKILIFIDAESSLFAGGCGQPIILFFYIF